MAFVNDGEVDKSESRAGLRVMGIDRRLGPEDGGECESDWLAGGECAGSSDERS